MWSTVPAERRSADPPYPSAPNRARSAPAARGTRLERASQCFLCSLWVDDAEQRRCDLCGAHDERSTPRPEP